MLVLRFVLYTLSIELGGWSPVGGHYQLVNRMLRFIVRKIDLVFLLVFIAVSATLIRPTGVSVPAVGPMLTKSGWEILSSPYELAGLTLGMTTAEVQARLGRPTEFYQKNSETSLMDYPHLHLIFIEERLLAMSGRGVLLEDGKILPGYKARQADVRATFGKPHREEVVWVYNFRPTELAFCFENGIVSEVRLATEVKGRPMSITPSPVP